MMGFGGAIVKASAFQFTSDIIWVRFALRTHDTYVKRVSQRSTENLEFSLGTQVSSHRRKCSQS
jgi:hypothetical protein